MADQSMAVVIGATGGLGRNVVRQFQHAGWRVGGLLMRPSSLRARWGQTFNITSAPFDFGAAGEILRRELGVPAAGVTMPEMPVQWEYDLSKAKRLLGYEPQFDGARVAQEAVAWKRGKLLEAIRNVD